VPAFVSEAFAITLRGICRPSPETLGLTKPTDGIYDTVQHHLGQAWHGGTRRRLPPSQIMQLTADKGYGTLLM